LQAKFQPALILAGLLFALTACGREGNRNSGVTLPILGTANPGTSSTAGKLCDNSLYPSAQGATWVYTSIGAPGGAFIYANSITQKWEDGFTLTTQFANQTLTQEWACLPDGLVTQQLSGGSTAEISMQDMTTHLKTSEVNGESIPKNITPGMQWQYSLHLQGSIVMPDNLQASAEGIYSTTMQEAGREIVTVPAGTFEAVKIKSNSTVDITSSFAGANLPIKFNGAALTWYAPGVGYVKMIESGDFGGQMYSVTTELQSYNIP
jgi:hypothetical protein